jgi:hypothetical protein
MRLFMPGAPIGVKQRDACFGGFRPVCAIGLFAFMGSLR